MHHEILRVYSNFEGLTTFALSSDLQGNELGLE